MILKCDFTAKPGTEASVAAGCENNDECPEYTKCVNRQCINPCAQENPCAKNALCRVISHNVVCTCPSGFIGTPETSCERRKLFNYR